MKERTMYKWKSSVEQFYKNADAQKVGEEIQIIGNSGEINAKSVVKYARENQSCELHKIIEWDDTKAAEKYREFQARRILTAVTIVRPEHKADEELPEIRPEIRAFYNEKGSRYMPVTTIVRNEDSYKNLLKQAMIELQAFKKKYSMLVELKEIFDLI